MATSRKTRSKRDGDGGAHAASAADAREGAGRVREPGVRCLSAHTLLSLTQKIEVLYRRTCARFATLVAFQMLCEKYDVDAKLVELVQQTEEAKLRAIAREDEEINGEEESAAVAADDRDDAVPASALTSPEAIVRAERLRVMEQEKRESQLLLLRESAEIEQLDASVDGVRRAALEQVERMQSAARHVDSARQLARDYAAHS